MSDSELSELMVELLRAQAHRCGSPLSEVRVNTEDKAKDAGCDGWTGKPAKKDEWLGDVDTCWQLKAGTAGTPSRLKGEVKKPIPQSTLKTGGRFVVVATGSTNGVKGEEDRLKTLKGEASEEGLPTDHIEVIGSERLANWCNQNPAVAARWAGSPYGLWTLNVWSKAEVHQVPWQALDAVKDEIAHQRTALEFETGSVLHLHIHGPPGVGKTRFALELCRDAPWAASVIYIQQASDLRLLELIEGAVADAAVRLVVVADEIQPEQLLPLRDSIARADGRIRLITIGHCPTPEPSRIPALSVRPLDRDMASQVVRGWYPAMPTEHVDFVVRFADGYVRLARLAADAVAKDTSIDVRGLLSRDEIRSFLDGMLGTEDRRALYIVAVLNSVGWTDEVQIEGKAIADHFELNWYDVRAKVDNFDRRLGIVPRSGRYRYISPTPLGIHLAVEAWATFPDLLRSLPDALPTEGAKDAYYERLRSMASNPQAREYAREELAFFFRIDDFADARAVRRWSAIASADPDQAAKNILRALEGSSVEKRLKIEDRARREMVWTLDRLVWRSGSFADAAKALALLAEAENETWANNATGEFIERYQLFLGGTAIPYMDRLATLDELASEGRGPLTRLVIRALSRVGERQSVRMGHEPPSDEVPEEEWHPSSNEEYIECVLAALERLKQLAGQGVAELQDDFISVAKELAMMLRDDKLRDAVVVLFKAIRSAYPESREPLRRAIDDVVFRERKYWKELSGKELDALDALHESFVDASLPARVQQHVGRSSWERLEQQEQDLRPIAKELIGDPTTLVKIWPWLTSGGAEDGWRLGEALAEEDTNNTLLNLIQDIEGTGKDLRTLGGYINTARHKRGDTWYGDWFLSQSQHKPRPLRLLFEITWRCGVTPVVAKCLEEIFRTDSVDPDIVGQLGYGQWVEKIAHKLLSDLIRAMVDAGHLATALTIIEHRTKAQPEDTGRWENLALELITAPELIRSTHMTGYYWKELALHYVDEHPRKIAVAIIKEQADSSDGAWFAEHRDAAQVLYACVERNPQAVWNALLPQLSSKVDAYMFTIGFPRGVVERVPSDQVISWVEDNPEERASMVARLISINFSNDETLAARIVGTYGDLEDVASAFFSEYISGTWIGSASQHWEQLATDIAEIAQHTKLPKLRRWAKDSVSKLRKMAERDRMREEEEDLRGY